MNPLERPSVTQVYNTLSKFRSIHPAIEELPERLRLQVQSVKCSFTRVKNPQFFVKFEYGDKDHTTSLTTRAAAGDGYTWFASSTPFPLVSVTKPRTGNIQNPG